MKKIVLLDVHGIVHRAYHALPDFQTKDGRPTGALYGLSTMLISIIQDLKPDILIGAYDLPKPTFRHNAYEDYKGTRKKTDENLIEQLKASYEIFEAFDIPVYSKEGYEADDVLGTLAEKLKKDEKNKIVIASGDMDILQLVDDKKVQVYTFKKGVKETILYDEKAVIEKMGFAPEFIPDYKGLAGDSSDNIPGIPGVGQKTATILIQAYQSVENIYKNLKDDEKVFKEKTGLTPRIINLLKEYKEEAYFSKELAKIRTDVEFEFELQKDSFKEKLDLKKTDEVFKKYEFRVLNDRLKKALGLNEKESLGENKKIEIDERELKELKLAVTILNPNLTNPKLEDILKFDN